LLVRDHIFSSFAFTNVLFVFQNPLQLDRQPWHAFAMDSPPLWVIVGKDTAAEVGFRVTGILMDKNLPPFDRYVNKITDKAFNLCFIV